MALADARAVLPALETMPAEPAADAGALVRLAAWCGHYSPWSAVDRSASPRIQGGAIWLDVTGCAHLFGGETELLRDLTARLERAGYSARAGLADTPGAAWAAARFAAGMEDQPWVIIPPGDVHAALMPLPVAALRFTPETVAGLEALGLRRVGDVAKLPRAALAARFRDTVAARLDAALGRRPEPLSPLPPVTPHFARLGFAEPVGRTEDIARALDRLLAQLCAGLERAGEGARRLTLTLFEPDGGTRRLAAGTSRASRDAAHLARLFAERLDGIEAEFGIEAMTLAAPAAERLEAAQAALSGDRASGDDNTGRLIDRLVNRLGPARIVRFAAHESHIPERAQRAIPALDGPGAASGGPGAADDAAWPAAIRPVRLLSRPEAIEATAPVPDDPPVMFRWRRVLHRVARADGPERLAPEWWRDQNAEDSAATRDYYRIEDTDGRRFWVYREGIYRPDAHPAWFLHGIFE